MSKSRSVVSQITMPRGLKEQALMMAKKHRIGSFSEYLRQLIIADIKKG